MKRSPNAHRQIAEEVEELRDQVDIGLAEWRGPITSEPAITTCLNFMLQ